jgi:molecular chaperone IbpA
MAGTNTSLQGGCEHAYIRFELPLFVSTVGFDRFADMLDSLRRWIASVTLPPVQHRADPRETLPDFARRRGLCREGPRVEVKEGVLVRLRQARGEKETVQPRYLHQGIAGRSFERRFQLAENVEVKGAQLENGLLHVDLERIVPEEKKPRRITIGGKPEAR